MKAFLGLGVLCLLICLTWADDQRVTVECNLLMFRVFVKKNLFGDGVPVRAEELTLGHGCPVNVEMRDSFELFYSVMECGIEFEAYETHVIYKTQLHYFSLCPVLGRNSCDFPLSCQVYRTIGPVQPPNVSQKSYKDKKRPVRMQASVVSSTHWSPELYQALGKTKDQSSSEEIESWNWVSFPILTLSCVVSTISP
ncbi:placenta-specific protein 1-like [Dromiciops gliroides]|uniref:placenta-specific protein 1-like n=1 Tax=Dromiciops gliroides TaxID=33562 RepID=UPI001CC6347F|nr:placenta-specific protein 1-like [Dromiciops gliroides]